MACKGKAQQVVVVQREVGWYHNRPSFNGDG